MTYSEPGSARNSRLPRASLGVDFTGAGSGLASAGADGVVDGAGCSASRAGRARIASCEGGGADVGAVGAGCGRVSGGCAGAGAPSATGSGFDGAGSVGAAGAEATSAAGSGLAGSGAGGDGGAATWGAGVGAAD